MLSSRKTRVGFMSHTYQTPPLAPSEPTKDLPSGVYVCVCACNPPTTNIQHPDPYTDIITSSNCEYDSWSECVNLI